MNWNEIYGNNPSAIECDKINACIGNIESI